MLPNMSGVLSGWAVPCVRKTAVTTTVNFVPTTVITSTSIMAVVQPADMEKIKVSNIDFSLEYLQFHSVILLEVGQYITYGGKDYKIITAGNYSLYGFSDVIGEEVKGGIK